MTDLSTLALQGLQIVWINILLSGDNAVVIALACRDLETRTRRRAVLAGSVAAIVLRVVFTIFIVELLKFPYVKIVSGLLLFWIAFELVRGGDDKEVGAAKSFWPAVRTIALADAIMSLDNVVAVAAAARGSLGLIIFGIAVSVPLIVFGSTIVLKLLERFPILVAAGAVLLGWVAGEIIATDPRLDDLARMAGIAELPHKFELMAAAAGATLMAMISLFLYVRRRLAGHPVETAPSDP